jgi:hypothetical protein
VAHLREKTEAPTLAREKKKLHGSALRTLAPQQTTNQDIAARLPGRTGTQMAQRKENRQPSSMETKTEADGDADAGESQDHRRHPAGSFGRRKTNKSAAARKLWRGAARLRANTEANPSALKRKSEPAALAGNREHNFKQNRFWAGPSRTREELETERIHRQEMEISPHLVASRTTNQNRKFEFSDPKTKSQEKRPTQIFQ